MFKGSKKGSDGPNEVAASLIIEHFDVRDDRAEMILNPSSDALWRERRWSIVPN